MNAALQVQQGAPSSAAKATDRFCSCSNDQEHIPSPHDDPTQVHCVMPITLLNSQRDGRTGIGLEHVLVTNEIMKNKNNKGKEYCL